MPPMVCLCCADVAGSPENASLKAHSAKIAAQLSHLKSLLDSKGAINMQAVGASAFVPLMKVRCACMFSQICLWMKT